MKNIKKKKLIDIKVFCKLINFIHFCDIMSDTENVETIPDAIAVMMDMSITTVLISSTVNN